MVILGIDPGTATVGFAVIEKSGRKVSALDYGVITTSARLTLAERLVIIAKDLREILKAHRPELVVIESLFFFKNQKTAFAVAQARGALLLTVSEFGCRVKEVTPLQVKQAVSGYGRADKKQIQKMVKEIYCLDCIPKPDDAADALAIAFVGS